MKMSGGGRKRGICLSKKKGSVSIKQLAEDLQLSPGTVSIVLNGHGEKMRISKATQERVLEAASRMGYQPNVYAKRLRQGKDENSHLLIAVFTPYIKNVKNVLGSVMYGFQTVILNEQLPVDILMQTFVYSRLSEMKDVISSMYCNGAIIYGVSDDDVAFLQNETFDVPIVLFNRATEKYGSVYVEDYEAGKHVAELFTNSGCKSAGLIMPTDRSKAGSMRQLGFMDGCRQFGLALAPRNIQEDLLNIDGGYAAARRILDGGNAPEALFVQSSEMAAGAVHAIYEHGLKIPDDIKLISYGDSQLEEYMTPSLTAIHMPMEEMAAECLHLVLRMIRTNDWRPISRIEPLQFVFRQSCSNSPQMERNEKE